MFLFVKLTGSLLVLLSSISIGMYYSQKLKDRINELNELRFLFTAMGTEISYFNTIMPEIFLKLSSHSKSKVGFIFSGTIDNLAISSVKSITEAWEKSIISCRDKLNLKESDMKILINYGMNLGNSDEESQLKHLNFLIKQLEIQEKEAMAARERNSVLYRNLGVLGGVAVIIILI
jgi:stage III sporulation protein AB